MQKWYNIIINNSVFFSNMLLTLIDRNRSRQPLLGHNSELKLYNKVKYDSII